MPPSKERVCRSPHRDYRVAMASVVFLTSRAPSKMAQDLMLAGHRVFETVAVSPIALEHAAHSQRRRHSLLLDLSLLWRTHEVA